MEIFQVKNSAITVEVKLENETIWLNLNQIATLFERDKSVISRHFKNIFNEEELDINSTVAKNATVQNESGRLVTREIEYYNLDAIISVGYRVNSKRGTQFRIWATKILKENLVNGVTINQKRLDELKQSIKLIKNTISSNTISDKEAKEIIDVLSDYALGLDVLDGYDHQNLEISGLNFETNYLINYNEAKVAIEELRIKFGGSTLFGNEKDGSFKSSISTINQTFDGLDLYPSLEEKASNLLYFVIKNHSFSDGNKRIAAWIFVWYLNKNKYLYNSQGNKRIENNALVALTLMIAQSKPEEKEIIIKVIINLINNKNK